MKTELTIVAAQLAGATCPEDVFGTVDAAGLALTFKRLALVVHPDRNPEPDARGAAETAFRQLNDLKCEAERKLAAGTYGDRKRHGAPPAAAPHGPIEIVVGKQLFQIGDELAPGDVARLYCCDVTTGKDTESGLVLKIAQRPSENDLLENEARVLRELYPASGKEEGFLRYLPRLRDSFTLKNAKSARRANVIRHYPAHVSMADVKRLRPGGLDFRDAVWMFKRVLEALWHVHQRGFVHGAILPCHVLVHPGNHGAKLIDWCYAVESKKAHVKAISAPNRAFYPPEVFEKRAATPALDIYMAAATTSSMLDSAAPPWFTRLLDGCRLPAPARRPQDARELHWELSELLAKHVGKPTYRELRLP